MSFVAESGSGHAVARRRRARARRPQPRDAADGDGAGRRRGLHGVRRRADPQEGPAAGHRLRRRGRGRPRGRRAQGLHAHPASRSRSPAAASMPRQVERAVKLSKEKYCSATIDARARRPRSRRRSRSSTAIACRSATATSASAAVELAPVAATACAGGCGAQQAAHLHVDLDDAPLAGVVDELERERHRTLGRQRRAEVDEPQHRYRCSAKRVSPALQRRACRRPSACRRGSRRIEHDDLDARARPASHARERQRRSVIMSA